MAHLSESARFARVIASDLVEYFRAPDSPLALSETDAREFASHGLFLLRARFGHDDALEHYYADCIGGAFGSLSLEAPSLQALRATAAPFDPPAC